MIKFERPSPKLLALSFVFLSSSFAFAFTLERSLSTFNFSKEALFSTIPVLLLLFLTTALLITVALLSEKKFSALTVLAAAFLFVLPFTSLSIFWRVLVALVAFLGLFGLSLQAQGTHEAYTGFSASHFKGVVRNFFLLFIFILGIILYSSTSQALFRPAGGGFEIPEETLEPVVAKVVEAVGGVVRQQAGGRVPERELAPYVEEQLAQFLAQMGFAMKLKGQPKSLGEVTTRLTKSLKADLDEVVAPFMVYIPFLIAGIVVVAFFTLSPFVALFGEIALFLVYRFLILVRVLKFEEVERKVKRLALT